MRKNLSPEQRDKIREMIKQGMTHREISKKENVAVGLVSKIRNSVEPAKRVDILPLKETKVEGTGIIFNDTHIPFQDDKVLEVIFDFIKKEKPSWIAILGDFLDFYAISKFSKDPLRKNSLQEELDLCSSWLTRLRDENTTSDIVYLEGNHEERLRKYLWSNAPELSCLRCLSVPELLRLDNLRIKYAHNQIKLGNLWCTHGDTVRRYAGYSAKGAYDKYGTSMMMGHCHRLACFSHSTLDGNISVWENGCTCSLTPEYTSFPDWQQGFSVVNFVGGKPFVESIKIEDGTFVYGGKIYSKNL